MYVHSRESRAELHKIHETQCDPRLTKLSVATVQTDIIIVPTYPDEQSIIWQ